MSETVTEAMENAIHAWVVSSSGLAAGQICFAGQGQPEADGAWISIRIENERALGQPWKHVSKVYPAVPLADTEIRHDRTATATLRLECYAGGLSWQATRPDRVLSRVMNARTLYAVRKLLRDANVGLGPASTVQAAHYERSTVFQPRAFVEIVLNLVASATELTTRIEKAEVTSETPDPFTFTVEPFVDRSASVSAAATIAADSVKL